MTFQRTVQTWAQRAKESLNATGEAIGAKVDAFNERVQEIQDDANDYLDEQTAAAWEKVKKNPKTVAGMTLMGLGITEIVLNEHGKSLGSADTWNDGLVTPLKDMGGDIYAGLSGAYGEVKEFFQGDFKEFFKGDVKDVMTDWHTYLYAAIAAVALYAVSKGYDKLAEYLTEKPEPEPEPPVLNKEEVQERVDDLKMEEVALQEQESPDPEEVLNNKLDLNSATRILNAFGDKDTMTHSDLKDLLTKANRELILLQNDEDAADKDVALAKGLVEDLTGLVKKSQSPSEKIDEKLARVAVADDVDSEFGDGVDEIELMGEKDVEKEVLGVDSDAATVVSEDEDEARSEFSSYSR